MPDPCHPAVAATAIAHDAGGASSAWLHAIALLTGAPRPQPDREPGPAPQWRAGRHAPVITIIERPSASVAVVSWRDPTHCCYGEQVWSIGLAREDGVCALTGQRIARSTLVYRPQRCRPPALNADAMILATAMDAACGLASSP